MARPICRLSIRLVGMVALLGGVAALGLAPPARAADQEITIDKVVNGSAPVPVSFEVNLDCQPTGVIVGGVTFPGPGSQTLDATGITSCTVSEPMAGGASSVAFRCQATGRGQCVSETELKFLPGDGPATVTVTVTNTFNPPPTSSTAAPTTTTSTTTTSTTSTSTTSTSSTTTSSTTTTAMPATTRAGSTPGTAVSTATDEGGSSLTPAVVIAAIAGLAVIGLAVALVVQRRRQADQAAAIDQGVPGPPDQTFGPEVSPGSPSTTVTPPEEPPEGPPGTSPGGS